MASTELKTRIALKYDSYSNWQNSTVILKAGEVAICTIPTGASVNGIAEPPAILMKVGDGTHKFSELSWMQAVASDVYSWAKGPNKPEYSAGEITGLDKFIASEIQDTDTQYSVVAVAGEKYKFNLMSKGKDDTNFTSLVATIDLTEVGTRLAALETKVGDKSVSAQIADNNAELAFEGVTAGQGQIVSEVSQSNGVVSAKTRALVAADIPELAQSKITGLGDALAAKQDNLTFDGTYNATSNKVATVSTVTNAINGLNAEEVAAGTGEIISKASQVNGAIVVEKRALTKADIPTIDQSQVNGLGTALDAKQDNLKFTGTYNATTNPVALKDYVDKVIADVNGAMHFAGTVTGATFEEAVAAGSYNAGDVVLYGVDEYLYDGTDWHALGNESIYAHKTDVNTKFAEVEAAHKTDVDNLKATKQDNLTFDGTYGPDNAAATVSSVTSRITNAVSGLKNEDAAAEHKFVTAVKQSNGVVAITRAQPVVADVDGLQGALATLQDNINKKQDIVTFDGEYNASTNKAATISSITDKIGELKNEDAAVDKQVVVAVKQANGVVAPERKTLADIAWSGNANDLKQTEGDYLFFNCGTSSTVI